MSVDVEKRQTWPIRTQNDIVVARQQVRSWSAGLGFGIVDQTKLVTAASELARNTLVYGGGGEMTLERIRDGVRVGIRFAFEDEGPGIADVEKALEDGYTTGGGLGLGLGGARRLVNDFQIVSRPGFTRIVATRWK